MKYESLTVLVTFIAAILVHLLVALIIQVVWNLGLHAEIKELPKLSYIATLAGYSIIKIAFAPTQIAKTDK